LRENIAGCKSYNVTGNFRKGYLPKSLLKTDFTTECSQITVVVEIDARTVRFQAFHSSTFSLQLVGLQAFMT
jgi:hypothetical protein